MLDFRTLFLNGFICITPILNMEIKHDQHFLADESIINEIIKMSQINEEDVILEIGPGKGSLTKKLAEKGKRVIAIEIDKELKPYLEKLPKNIEIVFEDARKFLIERKNRNFNKIVSNIPYRMSEPLMHYLVFAKHVKLTILVVPKKFAEKIQKNPVFSAFLIIEIIKEIPKEAFFPIPNTSSAIISIVHRPNYEDDKDGNAFLRRKLYMQEDKKLKNGLREAIIDLYSLKNEKRLTIKEAEKIIENIGFDEKLLETKIENIPLESYMEIANKVETVI